MSNDRCTDCMVGQGRACHCRGTTPTDRRVLIVAGIALAIGWGALALLLGLL